MLSKVLSEIIKDKALDAFSIQNPEEKYKTAAQILAYRDANQLIENFITNGNWEVSG